MRSDHNMDTETKSWTDDLPVCHSTGAGVATNQFYKEDGSRQEAHKFDDRSFHCQVDENTCIYAIFSGQGGARVAEFALQRIAAEILLGQLNGKISEEDVKDVLRQSFISVEKGYIESVDSLLAKRTVLQCGLEGISQYEISRNYQDVVKEINAINNELSIGTSVVLALIHYSKLYICNIGNCRALLCKNDSNNVLRVVQLSVDHNLYNEDEILRVCQLGVDVQAFRQNPFFTTRCIGSYSYKAGYKDCAYLSGATREPIISQPEIVGAIPMDDSCRFLLLMSGGLCKSLSEIFSDDPNFVNKEIIQMAVEQFRVQSTLMGVSQSTVHKVVQMHHDAYMRQIEENTAVKFKSRDDLTLLVRNLNFPMPNANQRKIRQQVTFNPIIDHLSLTDTNSTQYDYNSTTSSSSSSSDRRENFDMIENRKIKPYVDFSDYYKNVELARAAGTLPPNIID